MGEPPGLGPAAGSVCSEIRHSTGLGGRAGGWECEAAARARARRPDRSQVAWHGTHFRVVRYHFSIWCQKRALRLPPRSRVRRPHRPDLPHPPHPPLCFFPFLKCRPPRPFPEPFRTGGAQERPFYSYQSPHLFHELITEDPAGGPMAPVPADALFKSTSTRTRESSRVRNSALHAAGRRPNSRGISPPPHARKRHRTPTMPKNTGNGQRFQRHLVATRGTEEGSAKRVIVRKGGPRPSNHGGGSSVPKAFRYVSRPSAIGAALRPRAPGGRWRELTPTPPSPPRANAGARPSTRWTCPRSPSSPRSTRTT